MSLTLPTLTEAEQHQLELILRAYVYDLATLRDTEAHAAYPAHPISTTRRSQIGIPGDPTGRGGVFLADHPTRRWAQWRADQVDAVYLHLDLDGRNFVAWTYWTTPEAHWRAVAQWLHLSEASYFRRRAGVLTAFALQLDPAWREPRLWFPDALPQVESGESDESGTLIPSEDEGPPEVGGV